MKEIKAIISAYDKLDRTATRAALATVVRVEGSSYRRTGARMLVTDNGVWVGGISGGCLEGDALKQARIAIAKSESTLITYDTTDDDPYQVGVGLGCNGVIDVLFTPLQFENKNNPVEVLKACVAANRQTHPLITITGLEGNWPNVKAGDIIQYDEAQSLAVLADAAAERELNDCIIALIENNKSMPFQVALANGKKLSAFIEILLPDIHLVLMGHQYDIFPLARIANEIGWRVTMVSNSLKINPKLIGSNDKVLDSSRWDEIIFDRYTAIVLMSHDYKTDKINLPKALKTNAFYVGMLGPRVRADKILEQLAAEGNAVAEENMDIIFAPAGLDIGALSPEEIALSIIAEIRAVFSKRDGGFLRLRQTAIHERT